MAKKGKRQKATRFSIEGFDNAHYKTTEAYARAVDALFDATTKAIATAAAKGTYDPNKLFSFDDHPQVKAVMQQATKQLANRLQATITTGSKKQWLFANQKNDGFLESVMDTSKLSKATLRKMQDKNLDALAAFQQRKVNGMDLSQRVWKYVGQYKEQIEDALDVGLGVGKSAQALARDVKQNLREPDRLFRRVRDKHGNLQLSKAAQAYHPGTGVYRSSVKNAQRLTRSEINMAYRESDWQRWQTLDFVVGIEIKRSNHDPLCKCKLCERLKGVYPKTFKFKGWHPQCMCYAIPIMMDEETFDENELGDLKAALRGTTYEHKAGKNTVIDVPDAMKEWIKENAEKQDGWASTPYFIKDNFKDGSLAKGLAIAPVKVKQVATEIPVEVKHTPLSEMPEQDVQDWRAKWQALWGEFDNTELEEATWSYKINTDAFCEMCESALYDMRDKAEYWRYDEAKAELARIKAEVLAKMAEAKTKARAKIDQFKADMDDGADWIDTRSARHTLDYAEKTYQEECAKKYGSFNSIVNANSIVFNKQAVADMKARYNDVIARANAIIANPQGKDVSALKEWVKKKPGANYGGWEIVEELEKALNNIGNTFEDISAKIQAATTIEDVRKVVVDDFKVLSALDVCDGVKVDTVKTLTTQVTKSIKMFGLQPIDLRVKPLTGKGANNTFMWANGRYIEVNARYFADSAIKNTVTKTFSDCAGDSWMQGKKQYIESQKANVAAYEKMAKDYDAEGNTYMADWSRKQAKKWQKEVDLWQGLLDAGMTRHNVFLSAETMMRDCIAHETGHTVQGQVMGYYGYWGQTKSTIPLSTQAALSSELKALYKRHKATCGWLSDYGRYKNEGEFFSESMVLYQHKRDVLPDDVREFFDVVISISNGGSLPDEMPTAKYKAPRKKRKTTKK